VRTVDVALDLPTAEVPLHDPVVSVTITVRPVTTNRSYEDGLRLDAAEPDRYYQPEVERVHLTEGGTAADQDRLVGGTLTAVLDVSGLGIGTHDVEVTADLPTGVTLVSASPAQVTVEIQAGRAGTGAASPTPTPGG
jgi:YbbR domain-containing protein